MKRWWQLGIVIIGTVGLLSYFIDDAFFSELTNPLGAVRLFKYFTIVTSVLAVTYFWMMYSMRLQMRSQSFDHFLGGIVIYETITFVIYAILLEGTYDQSVLDMIGNACLHYINPIVIVAYYIYYRKQYLFEQKDIISWFIYPILYLIFVLTHGLITNDYLYPFFQVTDVGIVGLISMIVILIGVHLVLSIFLVKIVSRR
ncbi:Pr6Pr family membrane protein [Candidatus Xianfuyuplasma coldseepsis]|uniref:Integral membrane protein n=1 Tax=Candidatus Xianfuyuplasma coldseepsis TaxID=2782163 RepID=A0A7L7KQ42_9MOLU|nr:Pr6Pr family membrane protein [Xianfuyuplasma coldseepsis]QMS84316.1 hypothetical protein G4Z02_00690 [Xianfuyuplasma coldseepsis]